MELELTIDDDLYNRLANRADRFGFESTERYSEVILETVIDELEGEQGGNQITDRLEDLGYL